MSDVTRTDPALSRRGLRDGWGQTTTLVLLQKLIDAAGAAPAAVARRAGLSTSEVHALRHLAMGLDGPADLARRLGVTTAAASGIVDRLVGHGHVERRPHPGDGRRTVLALTDHGRAEVFTLLAPMFRSLAALDDTLDDADRDVVDRFLAGAISAVQATLND